MTKRDAPFNEGPVSSNAAGSGSGERGDGAPPVGPVYRPRSYTPPPPDPAEALYYEGLAAYQHRNWEEALQRFSRLKELQPTRPGLEALLDEVRWFLQLQAASPNGSNASTSANAAIDANQNAVINGSRVARRRWRAWGLAAIGLVGVVALMLILLQDQLPWGRGSDRQAQELFNRGQARLAVGDYEGAQAAFEELLQISPDDPEAQVGLARAERLKTLAQGYASAEAAVAEEDWDTAAAEFAKILALDPTYSDAQARADVVTQRQRLAALYTDGSRLYDLGQWEDAIVQFEKIRELENTYRTEAVSEFLFVCYLNAGQGLIDHAETQPSTVQHAIDYFSRALVIHPRNRPAADARRLASLYLDAIQSLQTGSLDDAKDRLNLLLAESPSYANGQSAQDLYGILLDEAQVALSQGDIPKAISGYQAAQAVPVSDHTGATEGEKIARAITPTPYPTSTALPTGPAATGTPFAVARNTVLNVRSGPSLSYSVVSRADTTTPLAVTGRNSEGSWLRVCCFAGAPGWVAADLVRFDGSIQGLPIVATPLPPAAPVATPTSGPQLICISGRIMATSQQPLSGWLVTIEGPDGSQTQRSAADGTYRFPNLTAGTYTVAETLEPGFSAVSPQQSVVVIGPTEACVAVDFWNERSSGSSGPAPTATPRR